MARPIGISGNGARRLEVFPEGTDLTPKAVIVTDAYRMLTGFDRGPSVAVEGATFDDEEPTETGAVWWFPVPRSAAVNAGERITLPTAEADALITAERAEAV